MCGKIKNKKNLYKPFKVGCKFHCCCWDIIRVDLEWMCILKSILSFHIKIKILWRSKVSFLLYFWSWRIYLLQFSECSQTMYLKLFDRVTNPAVNTGESSINCRIEQCPRLNFNTERREASLLRIREKGPVCFSFSSLTSSTWFAVRVCGLEAKDRLNSTNDQ